MSSKVSMSTKKKQGGKKAGGADSKIVSELQLNVKKLLEDVRKLKNFEHETGLSFKKIDKTFDEIKLRNYEISEEQEKINKASEDILEQHTNAMNDLEEKTKRVVKIYNDIQKMINDFK